MRSLLTADEDEDREDQPEINLSAASLLGLFLGLVLICGVFFGFGYSVGRRANAVPSAVSNPVSTNDSGNGSTSAVKPVAASSPSGAQEATGGNVSSAAGAAPSPAAGDTSSEATPSPSFDLPIDETPPPEVPPTAHARVIRQPAPASTPVKPETSEPETSGPGTSGPKTSTASKTTASTPASAPANAATSATSSVEEMVQVAAVARRDDADVLVSALRQKGYSAVVRSEPQDKLLHVQIGPYGNRAQAMAMRQKLLSDGYNAIIKQ